MVILPSSVTLQTPERVGVGDLPEFSLRLGLTSVPLPGPVGFAAAGAGVVGAAGAGVAGAAGAGVTGAIWATCPAKRSCPVPISRNNRRFTCEFNSPLPWQATHTSVSPPIGAGCGVDGTGEITGACDQCMLLWPGPSPATRESPAGDVGVAACEPAGVGWCTVSADNLPEPCGTVRWTSPCPTLSETGVPISTAVLGVTRSTLAGGALAASYSNRFQRETWKPSRLRVTATQPI